MRSKKSVYLLIAGVVVLLLIYVAVAYNGLVKKEERVNQQWAEVQSTYQRRLDLIPNLVNVVKGVSDFEQGTLEEIAAARAKALSGLQSTTVNGENYAGQTRLQDSLAASVNRLIVVVEKYPALKGTAAYSGLQTQLEGTERRIKVARQDFNAAVADYNTSVRSSATGLVARLFGFKVKEGFTADAGSDKAVEIKF
ncbi:MAG: LemA family protein [Chitinophagaceae bacterium]|nr:LemA family protein [Chitinophagaceae bacterium]